MKKTPAFHPEHLALPGYESVTRNLQAKKLVKLNNRLNRPFRTVLPADLKCGLEHVSHPARDQVHVYFKSAKPSITNAMAYKQGTDIFLVQEAQFGFSIFDKGIYILKRQNK